MLFTGRRVVLTNSKKSAIVKARDLKQLVDSFITTAKLNEKDSSKEIKQFCTNMTEIAVKVLASIAAGFGKFNIKVPTVAYRLENGHGKDYEGALSNMRGVALVLTEYCLYWGNNDECIVKLAQTRLIVDAMRKFQKAGRLPIKIEVEYDLPDVLKMLRQGEKLAAAIGQCLPDGKTEFAAGDVIGVDNWKADSGVDVKFESEDLKIYKRSLVSSAGRARDILPKPSDYSIYKGDRTYELTEFDEW